MRKILLFIITCSLFCSCAKVTQKLPRWLGGKIAAQTVRELTATELGPALHKALSVLPEESRSFLCQSLAKDEKLLLFFKENPRFVSTWEYLRPQIQDDCLNVAFIKIFTHADDYASYGGNKIENFVLKRLKDGSYEVRSKVEDATLAIIKKGNVIEVVGENVNNWFLQLKPLSDCKYRINGAEYEIDELGRVAKAHFNINSKSLQNIGHRDQKVNDQMRLLKNSKDGDHAGHLLADEFGGSSNMVNLVPMQGNNVNQSQYTRLENIWKKAAKEGKEVKVDIKLQYPFVEPHPNALGNSVSPVARPEYFEVRYEINGEVVTEVIKNI